MVYKYKGLLLKKKIDAKEILILFGVGFCFAFIAPIVYWKDLSAVGLLYIVLFLCGLLLTSLFIPLFHRSINISGSSITYYFAIFFTIFLMMFLGYKLDFLKVVFILFLLVILGFLGLRVSAIRNMIDFYKNIYSQIIVENEIDESKYQGSSYLNKLINDEVKKNNLFKFLVGKYLGYTFFIIVFLLTGGSKYGGGSILYSILPDGGPPFLLLGALIALNLSIWPQAIVNYYIEQKAFNELRKEYAENGEKPT